MADSNELIEILKRLELNQEQLAIGQRILSEQLEVLQEDRHANAEQFRSHRERFGGYGARNIAAKLRARGGQESEASSRKVNRHRATAAAISLTNDGTNNLDTFFITAMDYDYTTNQLRVSVNVPDSKLDARLAANKILGSAGIARGVR